MPHAIIQARMASTRLPGKVLADVQGRPLLRHMLDRVARAKSLDGVLVATTDQPADDPIAAQCGAWGAPVFRGSEHDVLDRYYQAARLAKADAVVRLTSDCPLIDPAVIDEVVSAFQNGGYDYVANTAPPEGSTYPDGMDVEVFSFGALERAWREARKPSEREHVTFHFWKNPSLYRTRRVDLPRNLSKVRLTVDYPEDLEVVRAVLEALRPQDPAFGLDSIVAWLAAHPEVAARNANVGSNQGWKPALDADARLAASPRRRSLEMQARARQRIPGVTQLLSKRPEMFAPGQWPGYYSRAKGCETWDLDGNRYIDMSINGIGANVLGFADPDVDAAVKAAIEAGSSSSLNCPEEVELADLLCELHPWADMVRYARSGGESMAIAVRIARAHTRRDKVAFCGYHGWSDWYLAANLGATQALDGHLLPGLDPAGVPRGLAGTALPFRYNHAEELERILKEHRGEVGAVVMEPIRDHDPEGGFLQRARELADEHGAVLVFDEITAAMRLTTGGAHLTLGVEPDIAVFAKAIGNGYPIGAVVGRRDVMQAAQSTFISSTNWTERVGPAAALATIRKHRRLDVAPRLVEAGRAVQRGWTEAAAEAGLKVHVSGIPPLSHFDVEGPDGKALQTLFTQRMLERGFLASGRYYATYAHRDEHIAAYLEAVRDVFRELAEAAAKGDVQRRLGGPVAHSGFRRLT